MSKQTCITVDMLGCLKYLEISAHRHLVLRVIVSIMKQIIEKIHNFNRLLNMEQKETNI